MAGSSGPGPVAGVQYRGDVVLERKAKEGDASRAADTRHLVLWEDQFSFFTSEEEFGAQQRPRKQVPLDALLGVKVDEDTVTLSLSDRELSFRVAGRKDAEGWGKAFDGARSQQAASAEEVEPEGSQVDALCLHEGELTMSQTAAAGQRDAWLAPVSGIHFVLYQDRLEWFLTPEALQGGSPDGRIAIEDIEDLEYEDTQVGIHTSDGFIRVLQEEHDGDMQAWIDAFAQILETDEPYEPYEPADRTFETNADLSEGPSRCVHEGLLYLVGPDHIEEPRHVVLYGDKIDFFDSQAESDAGDAPSFSFETAEVRQLTVRDDPAPGFSIGLDDEQLELVMPQDADFEAWISALRSVMEQSADKASAEPQQAPALSSPLAMSSASTATTATAFGSKTHAAAEQPLWQEMADPRVVSWLESARSCPADMAYFHGVLWLQRAQKQLPRFCVLYTDRIDSWASPLQAARRQPPEGRIMLSDVRGLSVIGGGLVLNLKGRKMGIYIEDAACRQGWTKALQAAFDMDGTDCQPWKPAWREAPQGSPPSPVRAQAAPGQPFVPRVASLPSPRSRSAAQSVKSPRSAVDARWQTSPHNPGDRICCPQSPLVSDAFVHRPEGSKAIAAKVNPPAATAKDKTTSGRPSVAEKVSEPRFVPDTPPRERAGAPKITGSTPSGPRSPCSRSPKGEGPVSPNVNAADRVPLHRKSPATTGLVGKITGSVPGHRSPRPITEKVTSR